MNPSHELALLRKDFESGLALLRKDIDLAIERLEHRLERRIAKAKIQTIAWLVGIVLLAQIAAHIWK